MTYIVKIYMVFFLLYAKPINGDFDPNAVSHTTKTKVLQMIENGNEEFLVYFCELSLNIVYIYIIHIFVYNAFLLYCNQIKSIRYMCI